MPKKPPLSDNPYRDIIDLAVDLRDPNGGCPWDLEQTHASLRPHLIEEAYETLESIDAVTGLEGPSNVSRYSGNPSASNTISDHDLEVINNFKEELGDLVFQAVIHSQLASEKGWFNLDEVLASVRDKLIFRHPHVYGDVETASSSEVLKNWEQLKARENEKKLNRRQSALDGVPAHLPALARAQKLGSRAAKVNFDWPKNPEGLSLLLSKIHEEISELENELPGDPAEIEKLPASQKERINEELGDLLFACAQLARMYGVDAEGSLRLAGDKFMRRFAAMEKEFAEQIKSGNYPSLEEWDKCWALIKLKELV